MSHISSSKVLKSAKLSLYMISGKNGPGKLYLYEMEKPFEESAIWVWYSTGYPWANPGGDFDTDNPIDSIDITVDALLTPGWFTFSIPNEKITDYLDTPEKNMGFMIKGASNQMYMHFSSSENFEVEKRPKLILNFEDGTDTEETIPKQNVFTLSKMDGAFTVGFRDSGTRTISLHNINGRELQQWIITGNALSIPHIPTGYYLLKVHENDSWYTIPFVN